MQRSNRLGSNHIWTDIHAANLHNAWLFTVSDGEDCAEIEVMRDHDIVIGRRILQDFRITRVGPAQIRPMLRLPPSVSQRRHPAW